MFSESTCHYYESIFLNFSLSFSDFLLLLQLKWLNHTIFHCFQWNCVQKVFLLCHSIVSTSCIVEGEKQRCEHFGALCFLLMDDFFFGLFFPLIWCHEVFMEDPPLKNEKLRELWEMTYPTTDYHEIFVNCSHKIFISSFPLRDWMMPLCCQSYVPSHCALLLFFCRLLLSTKCCGH